MHMLQLHSTSHQSSYNATKSLSLYFKPSQIKTTSPSFVSRKHVIPAVDKCKYLGIVVSQTNCDNDLKKANAKVLCKRQHIITKIQFLFSRCKMLYV